MFLLEGYRYKNIDLDTEFFTLSVDYNLGGYKYRQYRVREKPYLSTNFVGDPPMIYNRESSDNID